MKFASALSTVLVLLPAFTNAIVIPAPVDATEVLRRDGILAREIQGGIVARQNNKKGRNRGGQNKNGGNNKGGNNKGGNNNNNNTANNATNTATNNATNNTANANNNVATNTTVDAANNTANATANTNTANATANTNTANATANTNTAVQNNNAAGGNNNNNEQASLNLDPSLVATGLEQDGQSPPVAGQVASLTSKNNFINFCAGQTITNGQQITTGSCNPVPMGDIIPQANMPSSKFTFPTNFGTVAANKAFNATLAVKNMDTGHFVNAQKNYFAAPQQLTPQNILRAHSHIVIQKMGDLGSPSILDPTTFAFFKGLNDPANNGVLSANVLNGLPAGNYRMASINTGANHAPAVAAVAQHGFFDDMVYFTAQ